MSDCGAAVGVVRAVAKGHCHGCEARLQGFKRKWCGEACERRYWRNHAWTPARWEAIHRASVHEPLTDDLREWGWAYGQIIWTICDDCGDAVHGAPEVNHVDPRRGRGYGPGCHHHQTNLQVLCHDCHVRETTRQRAARLVRLPAPEQEVLGLTA